MGTGSSNGSENCMLLLDVQDLGEGMAVLKCSEPGKERFMEVPVKPDHRKSVDEAFEILDDFIGLSPESPVTIVSFDHDHRLVQDLYRRFKRSMQDNPQSFSIEYLINRRDPSDLMLMHGIGADVPSELQEENHWDFLQKIYAICRFYHC